MPNQASPRWSLTGLDGDLAGLEDHAWTIYNVPKIQLYRQRVISPKNVHSVIICSTNIVPTHQKKNELEHKGIFRNVLI